MILKGKTFISTVSSQKSEEIKKIFEPTGAYIIDFPMTEIIAEPLTPVIKSALDIIHEFDWLVFTSINGVKSFLNLLELNHTNKNILKNANIATVGLKTASEFEKNNLKVRFTSSGNTAEDMINELMRQHEFEGKSVLLVLGNLAPNTLQEKLSPIANVSRINVYKTLKTELHENEIIHRIKQNDYDLVLFTSPSGIDHFTELLGINNIPKNLRIACIGNVTSKKAEQYGLSSLITARHSTYEGLAEEITKYYQKNS